MELLAEPRQQVPYDHICRLLYASEHTLKAIEKVRIAFNSAANITQATVAFGVATEEIMLHLVETGGGVPVQVNLQVNAQALHERYAEMLRKLEETDPQGPPENCDAG